MFFNDTRRNLSPLTNNWLVCVSLGNGSPDHGIQSTYGYLLSLSNGDESLDLYLNAMDPQEIYSLHIYSNTVRKLLLPT